MYESTQHNEALKVCSQSREILISKKITGGLKKELTAPKSGIKSEKKLTKPIQESTREAKVKEKQVLKSTPSEKSTKEQSKPRNPLSEELYPNMHLNRKYAALLKLIERRLALKRNVSERMKTDEVRTFSSVENNKTTNPESVKEDLLNIIEPVAPRKTKSNRDIWDSIVNLRPDNMKSIGLNEELFETKPAKKPTSNMYTLKVPQNKASVEKPTYTLKVPKSMSAQEKITLKEESKVTAVPSKSGVKIVVRAPRELKKEKPAKLVETKASKHQLIDKKPLNAQARTKLVEEPKNQATRYRTIQPNDAKKTLPIVKRKEHPIELEYNMQVSKRRSIEKVVSKEDLVSEIQAWVQNPDKEIKRQVKSERENVRPNDQNQSIKLRKIVGNALKMNATNKPLKTSQSDHATTSKIPVPNIVSKVAKEKLGQDIGANQRKGEGEAKPIFEKDDKFMSVEKSTRKMAQRPPWGE